MEQFFLTEYAVWILSANKLLSSHSIAEEQNKDGSFFLLSVFSLGFKGIFLRTCMGSANQEQVLAYSVILSSKASATYYWYPGQDFVYTSLPAELCV